MDKEFHRIPLENQAVLTVIPEDRFKTGTLSLYFLSSLSDGCQAAASLLTGMLGRGCAPCPSIRELDRKLEDLYDPTLSLRVYRAGETRITALELIFLEGKFLPERTETRRDGLDPVTLEAFELFFSLLLHPLTECKNGQTSFREELFQTEKKNLLAAIDAEENDRQAYALRRCITEMCQSEPYGQSDLGLRDEVAALTAEKLYAYYSSLLREQRLEIFYTGSLSPETVHDYLSEKLKEFPQRDPVPISPSVNTAVKPQLRKVREEKQIRQSKLCLGLRFSSVASSDAYPAFLLYRELLSVSPIAKLFMDVRERKQLCYDCSATCDGIKGILVIQAGIEREKEEETLSAIRRVLSDLREGYISDEEWKAAKQSLIGSLRELRDNPGGLAAWILKTRIGGTPLLPEEMIEAITALKPEAVKQAAIDMTEDTLYFLEGSLSPEEQEEDGYGT